MGDLKMNQPEPKPTLDRSRRHFFNECGVGLGKMALAGLLADSTRPARAAAAQSIDPLAVRPPHFPGKAKAVIHLFMAGAPSHLDLYDYKPALVKHDGKPIPPEVIGGQRYAFIRSDAAAMAPRFKFTKYGQAGMEMAEVLPHIGRIADDICLIRSVKTDQFNHAPAQIFFNTGFGQPGRPSMGSWVVYGLGSESRDLPAFVVMSTGAGISGGSANWSAGFLPTVYTGTRLRNSGDPILNVSNPPGIAPKVQADTINLVSSLNRQSLESLGDPEIQTRISSYEMAFRLQSSAPELMNLRSESKETLALYGADPDKPSFARACLLARRMVERGVRFINIYNEGWDAHSDLSGNHTNQCRNTDKAAAALVEDLKRRGMLDETLVIWGGEFGRTPMVETNPALGRALGRDHHPQAYTMWMAGGGIKAGFQYGKTDELGFNIVENPVHVHDIQATVLHSLGLDHERLTYVYQGRPFRLTDIHGKVVKEILA